MRAVQDLIERNNQKFAGHPLISFLDDQSVDPRKRLLIAPCMAFFAMSFSDLNRYVYRDTETDDVFQRIVNEHTLEDERHSAWFIADCKKLGWNRSMSFTDSMCFLWGRETIGVRRAVYDFSALLRHAMSFERYVVLEAIEGHGNVLFEATSRVAQQMTYETSKEYIFFGPHHLAAETGHAVGGNVARYQQEIDAYEPSESQASRATILVDAAYDIFTRYNDDLYQYAVRHAPDDDLIAKLY